MIAERQILLEQNDEYNNELSEASDVHGDNNDDDQSENEFDVRMEEPEVILAATSVDSNDFPVEETAPKRSVDTLESDLKVNKKVRRDSEHQPYS